MSPKIQKVAIIGGGISGVVSGKHLLAAGLDVSIFECSSGFGGVWVFDERQPAEPPYPSVKPYEAVSNYSKQRFRSVLQQIDNEGRLDSADEDELLFAPPGPCYESLKNNVATPLVEITNHPWPPGTENFVNHAIIKTYIEDAAKLSNLSKFTRFGTSVQGLLKQEGKWRVISQTMTRTKSNKLSFVTHEDDFDAVVVATGHYHTMRVPDIPGLKAWKSMWPDRVSHSKGYRRAKNYANQNVLLIGAGASSFDIAREIGQVAKNVYQSARGGAFDLPIEFLSPDAKRVGEVSHFAVDAQPMTSQRPARSDSFDKPIPFAIHLKDGTVLHSIHQVILCTGYHCTVPFLPHLHDDSMPIHEASASPTILVTDGTQFHNLHKDIFYIPDPTLIFVGVPYYTATFTLFEFQAMVVAAVLAGHADLPSEADMRAEYEARVTAKGYGRGFHSLRDKEMEYVNELLNWVNAEGVRRGRSPIQGHTENYKRVYERKRELIREALMQRNGEPKAANGTNEGEIEGVSISPS